MTISELYCLGRPLCLPCGPGTRVVGPTAIDERVRNNPGGLGHIESVMLNRHEGVKSAMPGLLERTARVAMVGALALTAWGCSSSTIPTAPSETTTAVTQPSAPAPAPVPEPVAAPPTARYRVTFQATWSAATHPDDFPASAHFSPLVGGTHDANVTFWQEGVVATLGIRNMAERGFTSTLSDEINVAIAAGKAERVFTGSGIGSPAATSLDFDVSQTYPLVTLVTMVAPSPDWFAGVAGLPLFENNAWVDERRIDLIPWDAGTDHGATFTSPDTPAEPTRPISRILTAPLSPGGRVTPLGTFVFTRLQ